MNSAKKIPNRTVGKQTAQCRHQGQPTAFEGGENTRDGGPADESSWPSCAAEDEVLLDGGGENTLAGEAAPFAL